ncbi:hypothetical protein JCM10212_001561 [Sporobolomyces blumeae]
MPPKITPASTKQGGGGPVDVSGYLADASADAIEPEVAQGPQGNWEVAYVYAFITKFTDLHQTDYHSSLRNVFDLEDALLKSSPGFESIDERPASNGVKSMEENGNGVAAKGEVKGEREGTDGDQGEAETTNGNGGAGSPPSSLSSLSDDEDSTTATSHRVAPAVPVVPLPPNPRISAVPPPVDPGKRVPPESDLLVQIIEAFRDNLGSVPDLNDYHGRKTWLTWMINFVQRRLSAPYRGGFRWETNLVRTRGLKPSQEVEAVFWNLRWEDKIHLLRQMVDFQLTSAIKIREMIKDSYDLGQQRNALRSPLTNPLIVDSLGSTVSRRHVFHLDSSPRLYCTSVVGPKTSTSTSSASSVGPGWATLSNSSRGYKAFLLTLAEPSYAVPGGVGYVAPSATDPFTAAAAAKGGAGAQGPKRGGGRGSKGKGPKAGSKDDPLRDERAVRAQLEQALPALAKYEEAMNDISIKQRRVAARYADRDEKMARQLSRVGSAPSTRSSRRTAARTVGSYANDGVGLGGPPGGGGDGEEEVDELAEDDDDEMDQNGAASKRRKLDRDDWDASSVASGSTRGGGGARSKKPLPPSIPGERRSRRVQSRRSTGTADEVGGEDEGHDQLDDDVDADEGVGQRDGHDEVDEVNDENGNDAEESKSSAGTAPAIEARQGEVDGANEAETGGADDANVKMDVEA